MDERRFRLKTGLDILIREPRHDGAPRYARAIRELTPRSRQLRFFTTRQDYSNQELDPFVHCDQDHVLGLVAVVLSPTGDEIDPVGIANVIVEESDPSLGEFSIVVSDEYQQIGVGTLLASQLASCSIEAGVVRWKGSCYADNHAVLALMRKLGEFSSLVCSEGVYEFVLELGMSC